MAMLGLFKRLWKAATMETFKEFLLNPEKCHFVLSLLFFFEIFVNCFVIQNVRYTEIDWKAYMQEVEGFLNGTTDYTLLKGDTGPLVYPAGFVYIFAGLYHLTSGGVNVRLAQYLFAALYQLTLITVFFIYARVKKVPPYAFFFMCCASYRIHSIYVLRLFNDPLAMTIFYASVCCLLLHHWTSACVLFSISVSVKMNLLLFSPALLLLLLTRFSLIQTIFHLSICAAIQLLLGLPFLLTNPLGYLHRAFEFSRQFIFTWTVNWRFLGEKLFLDRRLHVILLLCHVACLCAFFYLYWIRKQGGFKSFLTNVFLPTDDVANKTSTATPTSTLTPTTATSTPPTATSTPKPTKATSTPISTPTTTPKSTKTTTPTTTPTSTSTTTHLLLTPDHLVSLLFVCNFVGMVFSRSLHYQFYVWYFHTLPHILWSTHLSSPIRLVLLGVIEMCWNTYPSTNLSSLTLHLCHLIILASLFHAILSPRHGEDGGVVVAKAAKEGDRFSDVHLKREKVKKAN